MTFEVVYGIFRNSCFMRMDRLRTKLRTQKGVDVVSTSIPASTPFNILFIRQMTSRYARCRSLLHFFI